MRSRQWYKEKNQGKAHPHKHTIVTEVGPQVLKQLMDEVLWPNGTYTIDHQKAKAFWQGKHEDPFCHE